MWTAAATPARMVKVQKREACVFAWGWVFRSDHQKADAEYITMLAPLGPGSRVRVRVRVRVG